MVVFTKEKVKGLMAENGLKQIDIAVELNISIVALQQKLNGKTDFKLDEIRQLARTFNVDFIIPNKED